MSLVPWKEIQVLECQTNILELVMFTVISVGVISYLPVELIRNFSWIQLGVLVISALSFVVFYTGCKRSESGNKFGGK